MTTAQGSLLSPKHTAELESSCITPDVARLRGYETLYDTDESRHRLKELRIPRWAWRDASAFPGLLLPMYRVTGELIGCQFKPGVPQDAPGGRPQKYASPSGTPNHLDVPPAVADGVRDPSGVLWVTEGIKKADCLASHGWSVITLTGVFNWRTKHGTLGDWEDIPLGGRTVVICFDADARDNRNVMLAMQRFGRWLESKKARPMYLVVPGSVERPDGSAVPVKGVDDYLHAGGAPEGLRNAATDQPPADGVKDAAFSDAVLTDTVCSEELEGNYRWAKGLGWMQWTGKVWTEATQSAVIEKIRQWGLERFHQTLDEQRTDAHKDLRSQLDGWRSVLSAAKLGNLERLSRGVLECAATDFDADPDLLNCPNGIVDLRTGELRPSDPDQLMTKITGVDYIRDAVHPDWEKALTALPEDVLGWFQVRIGQAFTGHMTPDDIVVICQGGGENAKSTVSDTLALAAGLRSGYHLVVSDRVMLGHASENHPTEIMDFMGARYAVLEETPEERRLDTNRLKKLAGTYEITGRRIRQDPVTFVASHSLFINSNHQLVVDETDHGTWRRLALLRWPYTFRRRPEDVRGPFDRLADPTLRERLKSDPQAQEAALAWVVHGARAWYANDRIMPEMPDRVRRDTLEWRKRSDFVLAFADDHLTADYESCILGSELRSVFNAWVREKGSREWGDKTFLARFGGHDWVSQSGIEYKSIFNPKHISSLNGSSKKTGTIRAWLGVAWSDNPGGSDKDDKPDQPDKDPFNGGANQDHYTYYTSGINENSLSPRVVNPGRVIPVIGPESVSDSIKETKIEEYPPDPFGNMIVPAPAPEPLADPVGFDLETASGAELFTYGDGFVRLCGAIGADGRTVITKDPAEMVRMIEAAGAVYGHNALGFDGLALAFYSGLDWEAYAAKTTDTEIPARQAEPPRSRGHSSVDEYDLDHVAERCMVPGKTDDLGRLKRKYGGYDKIPQDDPEYNAYLVGDLEATKGVRDWFPAELSAYEQREHEIYSLMGRMTLNGFRVDQELLAERTAQGEEAKKAAADALHEKFGLPLGRYEYKGRGKARTSVWTPFASPLTTTEGIAWIEALWARHGVSNPVRAPKGGLSTSADTLDLMMASPQCPAELKEALGHMRTITTTRTVYQTIADHLAADGKVHSRVSMRQGSGRGSITKPGLTVMGKRGGRHIEREVLISDPGELLLSCDLSQVDMRAVAGHCQDPEYMTMFEPGKNFHREVAALMGCAYEDAKPLGHGYNYGMGAKRMIEKEGYDPDLVRAFFDVMARFEIKDAWTADVRRHAEQGLLLDNGFGRKMRTEPSWAYTVAPALMGQGCARDITLEAFLRLVRAHSEARRWLRTWVHDEAVFSVPEDRIIEASEWIKEAFTFDWTPAYRYDGQPFTGRPVPVLCDLSAPGRNWGEISAK